MNELKHTPGPWRVSNSNGMICVSAPKGHPHQSLCAVGYETAKTYPEEVQRGLRADTEANARLIAAAPELLEALTLLVEVGRCVLSPIHNSGALKDMTDHEVLVKAVEALEKAKGN